MQRQPCTTSHRQTYAQPVPPSPKKPLVSVFIAGFYLRQLSWLCPLSASCPPVGGSVGKKEKGLDAVQALQSLCCVSTVLASDPKPGTVRATTKNLHPNQSRYDADGASLLPELLMGVFLSWF